MFDLVSDIGSYAQFLPWVVGVRIRSRTEQEILADLLVGVGPLRVKFTSRVTLDRPGSVDVESIEWPLKYPQHHRRFRPHRQGGSNLDLNVEFAFRTRRLA